MARFLRVEFALQPLFRIDECLGVVLMTVGRVREVALWEGSKFDGLLSSSRFRVHLEFSTPPDRPRRRHQASLAARLDQASPSIPYALRGCGCGCGLGLEAKR